MEELSFYFRPVTLYSQQVTTLQLQPISKVHQGIRSDNQVKIFYLPNQVPDSSISGSKDACLTKRALASKEACNLLGLCDERMSRIMAACEQWPATKHCGTFNATSAMLLTRMDEPILHQTEKLTISVHVTKTLLAYEKKTQ
ncbi:hypothetical protein RRG08_002161 [Elysia crispata]|uniref:Uncharacterized protein n=1 Tax=Elysia crispata TaxID=231223 RepID=A0AAE1DDH0_9GAST|nr:hypothetical protein RRG08_002161 [Elysia crispata]